jgi:hypothetical protein
MFAVEAEELAALAGRMCAATRAENQAAGAQLVAVSEFDVLVLRRYGEHETWCSDTQAAICAEIAAALHISRHWAASYLYYARAMRIRLPKVGALLCAGNISYATFKTIVYRTDLIVDAQVLANVDATLAVRARRWPTMTRGRLAGYVDKVVANADRDAVRIRREQQAGREFSLWDSPCGLTEVFGRLISTDAHVLDARLDALAATVCEQDPRTHQQRRADALGALAAGADRLACGCRRRDCAAAAAMEKPVMIYVIAEQASVEGTGQLPGSLLGADALIPAELIADLADAARLQPVSPPPVDAPPEAGYTPSQALADFVRCRDLTCRFPGCDEPATGCDLDHTIPHGAGGPTHASNVKCLCRQHHLLKTFWGWQDQQLADGTVIWRAPSGQTYITTPGSALLFPSLCTPTGDISSADPDRREPCSERTATMPKRRRTRAQNRARYINAERKRNRHVRETRRQARQAARPGPAPPDPDDDPPPF